MLSARRVPAGTIAACALILLMAAFTGWLSVRRFVTFNAGMLDLGNATQSVWSVTQGRPLLYTDMSGIVSRMLGHMELIYYLLALPFRLFPSPVTLLVIQAALYAAGGWPVYRLAMRRLGSPGLGVMAALVYLLYPVAMTAVLYDVHGDTLAMPLVLFAIDALDERRWPHFAVFALLAASCKLYAVLAVLLLAGLLSLECYGGFRRERRAAYLIAAGCGVWIAALLALRVLLQSGAAGTQVVAANKDFAGYLAFYFAGILDPGTISLRLVNALVVIFPALALGLRGWRWFLAAWAYILPALLIRGAGSSYIFHHYALAVPFLVAAVIYGAENLQARLLARGRGTGPARLALVFTLALTAAGSIFLVQTPLGPLYYSFPYVSTNQIPARAPTPREQLKLAAVRAVPPDVPVWVNNFLAPRLAQRPEIYVTHYEKPLDPASATRILARVDLVIEDVFNPEFNPEVLSRVAQSPDFSLQDARDGLLTFRRRSGTEDSGLPYAIDILPDSAALGSRQIVTPTAALVGFQAETLPNHQARIRADWLLLAPPDPTRPPLIITTLGDKAGTRFVHLPALGLLPVAGWQPGQVYRETFTVPLPAGLAPGDYPLTTAWYDLRDPATRLGESVPVGKITVP